MASTKAWQEIREVLTCPVCLEEYNDQEPEVEVVVKEEPTSSTTSAAGKSWKSKSAKNKNASGGKDDPSAGGPVTSPSASTTTTPSSSSSSSSFRRNVRRTPIFLKCHHSVCKSCLRHMVTSQPTGLRRLTGARDQSREVTCPVCRHITSIPPEGLPTNFYVLKLLEGRRREHEETKSRMHVWCRSCDSVAMETCAQHDISTLSSILEELHREFFSDKETVVSILKGRIHRRRREARRFKQALEMLDKTTVDLKSCLLRKLERATIVQATAKSLLDQVQDMESRLSSCTPGKEPDEDVGVALSSTKPSSPSTAAPPALEARPPCPGLDLELHDDLLSPSSDDDMTSSLPLIDDEDDRRSRSSSTASSASPSPPPSPSGGGGAPRSISCLFSDETSLPRSRAVSLKVPEMCDPLTGSEREERIVLLRKFREKIKKINITAVEIVREAEGPSGRAEGERERPEISPEEILKTLTNIVNTIGSS
ncbi:uncharacterized protein LOC143020968 [Oratosquilla oratoria]|uniref:uncharacterized protein LOC143020968 n=1 Tax=Oratosquilla oratoria TaxID=337810 RepID=UPI003F75C1FA